MKMNLKHFFLFVVILISFAACDRVKKQTALPNLTHDENVCLEKFFKYVMLDEGAVYTLWGYKPMTVIPVSYYSDEEMRIAYEQMTEKEKKSVTILEGYDLPENWENWQSISSRFAIKRYLFFKKIDPEDAKCCLIYFVDIAQVVAVLQKNYEFFKRETGLDFNPLEEIHKIEAGSEFWQKALNHSALVGLLYGFGFENSVLFNCKYGKHPEFSNEFRQSLSPHFSDHSSYGKATLLTFSLPIFASFFDKDPTIEKYQQDREQIKRNYVGKNFLNLTLQKLLAY
jgi:hypothetical protein